MCNEEDTSVRSVGESNDSNRKDETAGDSGQDNSSSTSSGTKGSNKYCMTQPQTQLRQFEAANVLAIEPSVLLSFRNVFKQPDLKDSDSQLTYLLTLLKNIHQLFFEALDTLSASTGSGLSENTKTSDIFTRSTWKELIPDVSFFMRSMRESVLRGVSLSSSGLRCSAIPYFEETDLARWAKKFGATVSEELDEPSASNRTTHLLCVAHTNKLKIAISRGTAALNLMWLEKAIYTWKRPPESNFEFIHTRDRYRCLWDVPESSKSEDAANYKYSASTFDNFFNELKRSKDLTSAYDAHLGNGSINVTPEMSIGAISETVPEAATDKSREDTDTRNDDADEWEEFWDDLVAVPENTCHKF